MPYILNKTNGAVVATVQDASLDVSTDLTFLGKNYAGYGEVQNENFLKLLENFANTTAPTKPIEGQLWFNTIDKKLNSYDGVNWKSIANLEVSNADPTAGKTFTIGDLWYDSENLQLFAYNGSTFNLIGPSSGDDSKASWRGSREFSTLEGLQSPKYNLKSLVGIQNEVIAVVSNESYDVLAGSNSFPVSAYGQEVIKKGITLIGSDSITGSSEANKIFFWGSAAHSLRSNTSTSAAGLVCTTSTSNFAFTIPFLGPFNTSTGYSSAFNDPGLIYNPFVKTLKTSIFDGIATSAYYADLAERYESDQSYEPGTVVIVGGEKEITVTHKHADTAIAGIISTNPAYMMNSGAGENNTHPYVALRGKVPCKVIGTIKKGQLLVSSSYPGYAEVYKSGDDPNAVLGKALQDFEGVKGIIDVLV